MERVHIRRSLVTDIDSIIELLDQSWGGDFDKNTVIRYYHNCINQGSIFFVLLKDDKIVSMLMFSRLFKIIKGGTTIGLIEEVCTHNEYRGQGLGKKLVDYVVEFSRSTDCYKVILTCSDQLISFYSKCGFYQSGNTMRVDLN